MMLHIMLSPPCSPAAGSPLGASEKGQFTDGKESAGMFQTACNTQLAFKKKLVKKNTRLHPSVGKKRILVANGLSRMSQMPLQGTGFQ